MPEFAVDGAPMAGVGDGRSEFLDELTGEKPGSDRFGVVASRHLQAAKGVVMAVRIGWVGCEVGERRPIDALGGEQAKSVSGEEYLGRVVSTPNPLLVRQSEGVGSLAVQGRSPGTECSSAVSRA